MKVRNKKTGEIRDIKIVKREGNLRSGIDGRPLNNEYYDSLAELNEELEDYEEPKELYIVDARHECYTGILNIEENPEWCARLVELGLGFETEKEAEKAVENLKAWKRLKDKGFRFVKVSQGILGGEIRYKTNEESEEVVELLDLLFGGE